MNLKLNHKSVAHTDAEGAISIAYMYFLLKSERCRKIGDLNDTLMFGMIAHMLLKAIHEYSKTADELLTLADDIKLLVKGRAAF